MNSEQTKYRLKFLFQQIDLQTGEFIIGRSPTCNLTLEDPLVSRNHARINLGPKEALIEDLGSRNGTQLNSQPLKTPSTLKDNDRIRIGSHDLVFIVETQAKRSFRTTGGLITCPSCKVPMAIGTPKCPHCNTKIPSRVKCQECGAKQKVSGAFCMQCGARIKPNDATVPIKTGKHPDVSVWASDMVTEVIEKALQKGNYQQVAKSLEKKFSEYKEKSGDLALLSQISTYCLIVAENLHETNWIEWVVDSWREVGGVMPMEIFRALVDLGARAELEGALDMARTYIDGLDESEDHNRIQELRSCLDQ